MKRFYTLIVLLGLTVGVLTGCDNKPADTTPSTTTATNAAAGAASAATNAPAK